MPIGTSISPVLTTRPARAKTFVPLLVSVPMPANQSPPLRMIGGDVRVRLDVVDQRRQPHRPDSAGIRRTRARRAPPAFDRGDQRGLLAAHERAGAVPDVDRRSRSGVSMIAAPRYPGVRRLRGSPLRSRSPPADTRRGSTRSPRWRRRRRRRSPCPSSTRYGSLSSTLRSMNAPGSPSSALQMTYLG